MSEFNIAVNYLVRVQAYGPTHSLYQTARQDDSHGQSHLQMLSFLAIHDSTVAKLTHAPLVTVVSQYVALR